MTIDGALANQLGIQERDTANDGRFETHFTVPGDLADGTRLCDRGFVSGPGNNNGFDREKSNDVCFTVQGDSLASVPAPAETSPAAGAPERSATPAPLETPVDSAPPIPAPVGAGPAGRGTPGTGLGPDTAVLGTQDILPPHGFGSRRNAPPCDAGLAPRRNLPARQPIWDRRGKVNERHARKRRSGPRLRR